jgi:hypothetical protein
MSEFVSQEITKTFLLYITFCSTAMHTTWPPFLDSIIVSKLIQV